jgi:hypothetical protein
MAGATLRVIDQGDKSVGFSIDLSEFDQGGEPTPAVMIAVTTKALFDAELLEPLSRIVLDAIVHQKSPGEALKEKVSVTP